MYRKQWCVKELPNSPEGHGVATALRDTSEFHHRKRGRGKRGSDKRLHQDLPIELSERFTLYGSFKPHNWGGVIEPTRWERVYWRYIGTVNGKPRLKLLPNEGAK